MVDLRPFIVAHWKMNDNTASTVVLDSSGNNYNRTAQQNTSVLHTDGKVNGALQFNGTSDYINTNNTFQSVFQSDFLINLWVKPDDGQPGGFQYLVDSPVVVTDYIAITVGHTGNIQVSYAAGGALINIVSDLVFSNGQETWHWIMLIVKQIDTKIYGYLYFDNILIKSANVTGDMSDYSSTGLVLLGTQAEGPPYDYYFAGSLDDAGIFSLVNIPYTVQEIVDFLWNGVAGTEELVGGGMDYSTIWAW